jgi:hypothetical protein
MSSSHLSANTGDHGEWRESVLSTRSLSYMSTADAANPRDRSMSRGMTYPRRPGPVRQATEMTDDSDYSLEIAQRDIELNDIPELPESVAESPLFLLPREIRDRIYSFCLTAREGEPLEWPTEHLQCGLQPQLLRTCKIIYNEAGPMLYTLNDMTFHHPSDANMFVRAVSSQRFSHHVSKLSLHIRATDTRIWMPYIMTSRDRHRGLEYDFPHLRELSIRIRSNKWQHNLSPEANLKIWSEDERFDEIVDGIRSVYLPAGPQIPKTDDELDTYISNNPASFPLDPRQPEHEKEWSHIATARSELQRRQASMPTIRVTCAFRVHETHFTALTTPSSTASSTTSSNADQTNGPLRLPSPAIPSSPIAEGQPYRPFIAADLRANPVKRFNDAEAGSCATARTPFADKNGILLALEIHCLDPKPDSTATA